MPYLFTGVLLCFLGCQFFEKKQAITNTPAATVFSLLPDSIWWSASGIRLAPPMASYQQTCQAIALRKKQLRLAYQQKSIPLDSVRAAFTASLLNQIIPYWYNTPWSFEGHTAIPNQGEIACGYFVSTTLQDVGIALNRYRLAQKSPSDEAKALALGDSVQIVRQDATAEKFILSLKNKFPEGLYFIGLGSGHVGYLLHQKGQLLLIHANYSSPQVVVIQPVEASVFMGFDHFFITPLTFNDALLIAWLEGQKLKI